MRVTKYDPDDCFNLIAAVDIEEGQLVGIDTDGKAALADANATPAAGVASEAIGVAVRTAKAGAAVAVAPICTVDGFSSLTKGGKVWLSTTAGGVTQTRPATTGDIVQPVGRAKTATEIKFNVSQTAVKVQAAGSSTVEFL